MNEQDHVKNTIPFSLETMVKEINNLDKIQKAKLNEIVFDFCYNELKSNFSRGELGSKYFTKFINDAKIK